MITVSWGVSTVAEGTESFDTVEEALQYAQADFDLSDVQIEELKNMGYLFMPVAFDAFDWIRIDTIEKL